MLDVAMKRARQARPLRNMVIDRIGMQDIAQVEYFQNEGEDYVS